MTLKTKTILPLGALMIGLTIPVFGAGQDAALVKKGEEIYAAQKCATCHNIAGKGGKQSSLDGVGKKLSAEDIKAWIVSPAEMTKKTGSTKKPPMPAKWSKMPAADLDALVAYMHSLK
jgi:mono/diheme cytochrome c family protein